MLACYLCLEHKSENAQNYVQIDSETDDEDVSKIIAKHFGLKLNVNDKKKQICFDCWKTINSFHKLYEFVAATQQAFNEAKLDTGVGCGVGDGVDGVIAAQNVSLEEIDDPLPAQTLDIVAFNVTDEKLFNTTNRNNANENDLFCPEVKIEEHELEQLPKIEIIENTIGNEQHIEQNNGDGVVRVSSRLRQSKRFKSENIKNKNKSGGVKQETTAATAQQQQQLNSSSDSITAVEQIVGTKRRRGRPRKDKLESLAALSKETENNKIKTEIETDANSATNAILVKKGLNIENVNSAFNDVDADDDDDAANNMDADAAMDFADADDGDAASDASFQLGDAGADSDSDTSLTDFEKSSEEQYAVVPKRVVVRPKKYQKRTKPLVAPVRMKREDIERRRAQMEEYDNILAKFFNNKFACAVCNLLVHNFTEMVRHQRISHNIDQGFMTCCGRKFKQRKTLAEHALVHWNPAHFKCNNCDKTFQTGRLLEVHELTHTATGEDDEKDREIFQCDKCPRTFAKKTSFDYHTLMKHMPKSEFKFECTQCNKRLLTERKLKNHIKSAHDPENAIICDKCGRQMRTKHSLKKHLELMHSNEPRPEPVLMQCQICNTWLKDIRGLKQHMKSIHVESAGEHRCHICSKVSPNARALRRHIYHNHECERKFKCTMCEKAFKRPQELREHTSTHTGEVLYTCPNCPMTFFSSANMYKHRQRLHRAQYEADKNQPRPPNILRAAVGATAAMKMKFMHNPATEATTTSTTTPTQENPSITFTTKTITISTVDDVKFTI